MSRTTAEWRNIYKARNERRRSFSKSERAFNKKFGRALSQRKWDKNKNRRTDED